MTQENVLRWVGLVRRSAWWLIIPAILGLVAGAYQATRSDTVVYSSKMVLFFQPQLPSIDASGQTVGASQTGDSSSFLRSQAQQATSTATLRRAVKSLTSASVPTLKSNVSASVDGEAGTLTITARGTTAKRAIDTANAVGETLSAVGLEELSTRLKVRTGDLQRQVDRLAGTVDGLNKQLATEQAAGRDTTTLQARRATASSQYTTLVSSQQELLNQIALQRAPLAALEPATSAVRQRDASVPLRGLLGMGIGSLLGLALIAVRQFLDDTVRRVDQAEALVNFSLLAELPEERLGKGNMLPVIEHPGGGLAESFRGLRTALKFIDHGERLRSIAIISSEPGDGKTLTAANLAVSYAQSGSRVILVSADLRNPALDSLFEVTGERGFADLLGDPEFACLEDGFDDGFDDAVDEDDGAGEDNGSGEDDRSGEGDGSTVRPIRPARAARTDGSTRWNEVSRLLQFTDVDNLQVLPAGKVPPNPSELLARARARIVMDRLHQLSDVVIVDSPPLLVADPEIIGGLVDGLVLVVCINRTRIRRLRRALSRLSDSPLRMVGMVVNRTDPRRGYYGSYGSAYVKETPKPERRKKDGKGRGDTEASATL